MMKKIKLFFCLTLSVLLLTACSSKALSKAEEAYVSGDYQSVVNLIENMKKPDSDALALLNKARIHLAFDAGNYEQVIALAGDAGASDEEIARGVGEQGAVRDVFPDVIPDDLAALALLAGE